MAGWRILQFQLGLADRGGPSIGSPRSTETRWGMVKRKWTRAERAIVLLEHVRTPEAISILKEMATGHPEARPTVVAREALARIDGKAK